MARLITAVEVQAGRFHAVELAVQRRAVRPVRAVRERLPGTGPAAEEVARVLSTTGLSTTETAVVVPGDRLLVRRITVPFRERAKIRKVLPYEIEPLVPFAIHDLELQYRILAQEKGSSEILVWALPRAVLDRAESLFRDAGVRPRLFTVSCVAAAEALLAGAEERPGESFYHLHVGSSHSTLSVYIGGSMVHLQRLSGGEDDLEERIAAAAGMDRAALHARLAEGAALDPAEWREALARGPLPLADALARGMRTYVLSGGAQADVLVVTGASPVLDPLVSVLEQRLQVRTRRGGPAGPAAEPAGLEACTGAALIAAGRGTQGCAFRERKFSLWSRFRESPEARRRAAVLAAVVAGGLLLDSAVGIQVKAHRLDRLEAESRRILRETFPEVTTVVHPLDQMKLKIKDVEKQNEVFEQVFGQKPTALEILNEISRRIPPEISVAVTDLTLDAKSIRFLGWTDSFNAVNRIEQELGKSEMLGRVRVSNAKVDPRNQNRVNFQIRIDYKTP